MEIMNVTLPDEGRVLALLQPYFDNKLNPRRMSEWIPGKQISVDEPVPMLIRHTGGDYRRFLNVRGLPGANEIPRFSANIDVHNLKRGVWPIAAFEYHHYLRSPMILSKQSGQARGETYSGSLEPTT